VQHNWALVQGALQENVITGAPTPRKGFQRLSLLSISYKPSQTLKRIHKVTFTTWCG